MYSLQHFRPQIVSYRGTYLHILLRTISDLQLQKEKLSALQKGIRAAWLVQ